MNAIEFENVSKQYRLGLVGTQSLRHDLNRFWVTHVLGREDPYSKIGERNDRTIKGNSGYVWALDDISFSVKQGEVVGIIGRNGAGKSTLLKILSRVTAPTKGVARVNGRLGALLQVGTGFHQEMTGRENIYLNGAILGMTKAEITSKIDEIIDFSGCERYIDTPVKRYSTGMLVRLGFAVAAHLDTEVLVVDEVLAVGDAEFQKKAIGRIHDVSQGEGRTVLFVSHNMTAIRKLCTRGIVLDNGILTYDGDVETAIKHYAARNSDHNPNYNLFGGNDYVDVRTIKIKPADGNGLTVGSGFDVEVAFHYNRKNENISVMFQFLTPEDLLVLQHNEILTPNKDSKIADYDVTIHVPANLLNGGHYILKVCFVESAKYIVFGPCMVKFEIKNGVKPGVISGNISADVKIK